MSDLALPVAEVAYLTDVGHRRTFDRDEVLCLEGAPVGDVYLVESGSVRMVVTAISGRETLLDTRGPGELVGELSAFDGSARSASVYANEPTHVVALSRQRFLEVLAARPGLARCLLNALAEKVRAADRRTAGRDSADVTERVVTQLLSLSAAFVNSHGPQHPIRLELRQADLASWVGSTRETVARVLGDLRAKGCISTGRGRVDVIDLGMLRSLA